MAEFSCPACGAERTSADSDCESCGWERKPASQCGGTGENCPICGTSAFSWGRVDAHWPIKFQPEDGGVLGQLAGLGGEKLSARRCDRCGNVQLFVK